MTDAKMIKFLTTATIVMCTTTGSLVLWAYESNARASELEATLKVTKDSQRSAWQKVYDMQEQGDDKAEAAESKAQVLQWELDQCKASHEHH